MTLLTVVVPVYNSDKHLNMCIDSILMQTFNDFNLILIDDGSTDLSREICSFYSTLDERITIINKRNEGPSAARNIGLELAKSKYLLFVDSDDYIEKTMFEELTNIIRKTNSDILISGLYNDKFKNERLVESRQRKLKQRQLTLDNGNDFKELIGLFENEIINGPCAKIYKLEIIKRFNIRMSSSLCLQEDLLFNVEFLKHCNNVFISDSCYYHYITRDNENSLTKKYIPDKYFMLNYAHNHVISLFLNYWNLKESDLKSRIYYLHVKNIYSSFLDLFHKDCKMNRKQKILFIKSIISKADYKEKIDNSAKEGLKYKIILYFLKTNNPLIIYCVSKVFCLLKSITNIKFVK